tara:strand:+ start:737 stop:1924 length:1188 start_codon:yes stop_codon:yes gene_type:complete
MNEKFKGRGPNLSSDEEPWKYDFTNIDTTNLIPLYAQKEGGAITNKIVAYEIGSGMLYKGITIPIEGHVFYDGNGNRIRNKTKYIRYIQEYNRISGNLNKMIQKQQFDDMVSLLDKDVKEFIERLSKQRKNNPTWENLYMIYLLGWIKYGDFAKELSGIENFRSNLDITDSSTGGKMKDIIDRIDDQHELLETIQGIQSAEDFTKLVKTQYKKAIKGFILKLIKERLGLSDDDDDDIDVGDGDGEYLLKNYMADAIKKRLGAENVKVSETMPTRTKVLHDVSKIAQEVEEYINPDDEEELSDIAEDLDAMIGSTLDRLTYSNYSALKKGIFKLGEKIDKSIDKLSGKVDEAVEEVNKDTEEAGIVETIRRRDSTKLQRGNVGRQFSRRISGAMIA